MRKLKKKVIFIVGPTAVGKTDLAIRLASKIKGEIISADSMQAYKGMSIISQQPTPSDQEKIKHYLINFLSPLDEYSAAKFASESQKIINKIIKKGKIPIVTGGSGLYIKSLIDGIFPSHGKNELLRKKLYSLAEKKGSIVLHKKLKKIDPESAKSIHPNDLKKIIRALEIHSLEKKTKTDLKKCTKGIKDAFNIKLFGITRDRKELYERINRRVDSMFEAGVIEEAQSLLKQKLSITSSQALGIRQIKGYVDKLYDISHASELLKRDTRRFAKRQFTWFRADKRIKWFDIGKIVKEKLVLLMEKEIKN